MRATLAWIFTLAAGFAAFFSVATLALLPMEAADNRDIHAKVERYAKTLAASSKLPQNVNVDDPFAETSEGIHMWRSLPGGCHDTRFEAPSDRFSLGFWDSGNSDRFGSSWWYCYAYPSGRTTMPLSTMDYLMSAAGQQIVGCLVIMVVAGFFALVLRLGHNRKRLRPSIRAIWFSVMMTIIQFHAVLQDSGDDEFLKNPDDVKFFVFTYEHTIGSAMDGLFSIVAYLPSFVGTAFMMLELLIIPAMWFVLWRVTEQLIYMGKNRFGLTVSEGS
jgi:hypothetical protein